jgi:ABC-2 type transport system permease protein
VFFPVDNVPDWLAVISKLNPLTYGVDAIRQIILGQLPGIGVTIGDRTVTLLE